jgi:hypothetical protein
MRQFRNLEEGENMAGQGHGLENAREREVHYVLFLQVPDLVGAGEVRQQCDREQEFFCIRSSNGHSLTGQLVLLALQPPQRIFRCAVLFLFGGAASHR